MLTLIPYNPFKKCTPSLLSNFLFPASATDSFLLHGSTSDCTVAPRDGSQTELAKTNSKKGKLTSGEKKNHNNLSDRNSGSAQRRTSTSVSTRAVAGRKEKDTSSRLKEAVNFPLLRYMP